MRKEGEDEKRKMAGSTADAHGLLWQSRLPCRHGMQGFFNRSLFDIAGLFHRSLFDIAGLFHRSLFDIAGLFHRSLFDIAGLFHRSLFDIAGLFLRFRLPYRVQGAFPALEPHGPNYECDVCLYEEVED